MVDRAVGRRPPDAAARAVSRQGVAATSEGRKEEGARPRIKISAIHAYPVWVGNRNQLIVKVETDDGVHGWGESGMSYRERAVVGAVEHYREFLIGRDPMRTGSLWQEMYRSQYFEGGRVLSGAISAIDIAL